MKFFVSLTNEDGLLLDKFQVVLDSQYYTVKDPNEYEGEYVNPSDSELDSRLEYEIRKAQGQWRKNA